MVGVGYGKGAEVDESKVRWISPEELEDLRARNIPLRILDARDEEEFKQGSVPGAISMAQTSIMFAMAKVKVIIDQLVAGPDDEQIVMFANTAGPNSGMTAGREVYVMAYLHELGALQNPPLRKTCYTAVPPSRRCAYAQDGAALGWLPWMEGQRQVSARLEPSAAG